MVDGSELAKTAVVPYFVRMAGSNMIAFNVKVATRVRNMDF